MKRKLIVASLAGLLTISMVVPAYSQSREERQKSQSQRQGERQKQRASRQKSNDRECRASARLGGRLVHGEVKLQGREGKFVTAVTDQGTITAIEGSTRKVTIRRVDNEVVTVTASDSTRVCKDGARAEFGSLKVGDRARTRQNTADGTTTLKGIAAKSPS